MMDRNRQIDPTNALKQILSGSYQVDLKSIIVKANKLDNAFMQQLVENYKADKIPDDIIIKTILAFDKAVQNNELQQKDIDKLQKK